MIIGVGCDIVQHALTEKLNWFSDEETLIRFFSQPELELFKNEDKTVAFLSGRFAAKEAVRKCLKVGLEEGLPLTDIQILRAENGHPMLVIVDETKIISDNMGITSWHVTISHSSEYSVSFVVAEKAIV